VADAGAGRHGVAELRRRLNAGDWEVSARETINVADGLDVITFSSRFYFKLSACLAKKYDAFLSEYGVYNSSMAA